MADKKISEIDFDNEDVYDDEIIVEMTDEDGNSYLYVEEMIIPVNGERFALLVSVEPEGHVCEDDECDCGEGDVIIAKIVVNENGEDEYIEPTDEEFEAVQEAYEKLMDDLS